MMDDLYNPPATPTKLQDNTQRKNVGGRPRKYKTVQELENAIDDYFTFTTTPIYNKDGDVVDHKDGPYTMAGLALHLGFRSRRSLLNYNIYKEDGTDEIGESVDNPNGFLLAISRARLRCQAWTEGMGYDKDGSKNVPFMLMNNYPDENWSARQDININQTVTLQIGDLLPTEDARRRIEAARHATIDAEFAVVPALPESTP